MDGDIYSAAKEFEKMLRDAIPEAEMNPIDLQDGSDVVFEVKLPQSAWDVPTLEDIASMIADLGERYHLILNFMPRLKAA